MDNITICSKGIPGIPSQPPVARVALDLQTPSELVSTTPNPQVNGIHHYIATIPSTFWWKQTQNPTKTALRLDTRVRTHVPGPRVSGPQLGHSRSLLGGLFRRPVASGRLPFCLLHTSPLPQRSPTQIAFLDAGPYFVNFEQQLMHP